MNIPHGMKRNRLQIIKQSNVFYFKELVITAQTNKTYPYFEAMSASLNDNALRGAKKIHKNN